MSRKKFPDPAGGGVEATNSPSPIGCITDSSSDVMDNIEERMCTCYLMHQVCHNNNSNNTKFLLETKLTFTTCYNDVPNNKLPCRTAMYTRTQSFVMQAFNTTKHNT